MPKRNTLAINKGSDKILFETEGELVTGPVVSDLPSGQWPVQRPVTDPVVNDRSRGQWPVVSDRSALVVGPCQQPAVAPTRQQLGKRLSRVCRPTPWQRKVWLSMQRAAVFMAVSTATARSCCCYLPSPLPVPAKTALPWPPSARQP